MNLTLTKFDLRTINYFAKKGVIDAVKDVFNDGEDFEEFIEKYNDEFEALSSICSLHNPINFHDYAKQHYKFLKEEKHG